MSAARPKPYTKPPARAGGLTEAFGPAPAETMLNDRKAHDPRTNEGRTHPSLEGA
jgi:hypothetical protein